MALTYTTDIFTVVGKGHWIAFELLLTWTLAVEEQVYSSVAVPASEGSVLGGVIL
jgi:hypothetical protein